MLNELSLCRLGLMASCGHSMEALKGSGRELHGAASGTISLVAYLQQPALRGFPPVPGGASREIRLPILNYLGTRK